MCRILSHWAVGLLALVWVPLATAGLLTVETDAGGTATVDIEYINGGNASSIVVDGMAGDNSKKSGEITVKIGSQDEVSGAAVRSKVTGDANIKMRRTVAKMGYKGKLIDTTLQSFEPLDVDIFLPSDEDVILLSDYDIPLFLLNGIFFLQGQEFASIDGLIPNVSGLVFRDASSLFSSDDEFFNLSIAVGSPLWDNLPLYNGQVTVASQLEFRQIPEPGTGALIAGILIFLIRRHSGSQHPS